MARSGRKRGGFVAPVFKLLLCCSLFASFFLVMSINNGQMLRASRTTGVTAMTYAILSLALMSVYGGYAIGRQKSKPIVYSLTFAASITDAIAWLQMLVMNVNEANRPHFAVLGSDVALLALCVASHFALIVLFTFAGNFLYFKFSMRNYGPAAYTCRSSRNR